MHRARRQLEWKQLEIAQVDSRTLQVRNVVEDSKETLEFKDRVIKASVGFEHLVLTTPVAAYIYGTRNWSAPTLIDLKENAVSLILQCDKCARTFLLPSPSRSALIIMQILSRVRVPVIMAFLQFAVPVCCASTVRTRTAAKFALALQRGFYST